MPTRRSSASHRFKNHLGLGFRSADDVKVWEDTSCPICMEIPHNAVLLRCSSFENGCRPFMCNTSRRHSNCFDQFCKSPASAGTLREIPLDSTCRRWRCQSPMLHCPLCRGEIYGWTLVEQAREFMNNKARCCSSETCDFKGTYSELRKHARSDHSNRRRDRLRFEILRDYEDQQGSGLESLSEDSDLDIESYEDSSSEDSDMDIESINSIIQDVFRSRRRHRRFRYNNDSYIKDVRSRLRLRYRRFRDDNDSNTTDTFRRRHRLRRFRYDNDSDIKDVRSRLRSRHRRFRDGNDSNTTDVFRRRHRLRRFRYDNNFDIEDVRSRSRSRHRRFRYNNDSNREYVRSRSRHRRFRYNNDSNIEYVRSRSRHRRFRYDSEGV